MTKIAFILGTRPEIIKLYSSITECRDRGIDHVVINTDQHYDDAMRDVFFKELGLSQPQYQLGVGSGSHATMLATMLVALEEVLLREKPSIVVVQGDTNTVLAGCLVAIKMGIKVAHIEAGLRSYDRTMPEEHNRVVTDHCADYLFAPTQKQADILLSEGIPAERIFVTGNTIVDAVLGIAGAGPALSDKPYLLLTSHRPSNTDNHENLRSILTGIQEICERDGLECLFPVHPRLNSRLDYIKSFDRVKATSPLPYSELLTHIKSAALVFTDSGGIQEEACILRQKCLILRTNTERPETLEVGGAALLSAVTKSDIIATYDDLKRRTVDWYNPFGDGLAGKRIIATLEQAL